ncbi:GNAT family N-acetyltransferase [Pseudalkalibacillus decolorationis]|uniref:GNAT family N-acetyltransferase n=1 Tax=Pseudalkalibacillus decolorationis TaxID=163879 RepID=UPI0021484034|nr:GNAT family N-acetyltransferase [Pseudalkalibacillus decolorationis]
MSFVLSKENAVLIEQSEIDTLEDRLKAVKEIKGNPMGVEIRKFRNAFVFSVKNIPGPSFNTVKGISNNDVEDIDSILDFYLERDIPARFELTPANSTTDLLRTLSKKGYFHSGFHTALYRNLNVDLILNKELNSSIRIEEIKKDEFDTFGEIYTKGFNMPSFLKEHVTENNKVLDDKDNWTFYVASVEGEPAGVGVLFVKNGIGTLAASATVPELRNKGVQSALINKRIETAIKLNCNLIVGQAAYGSVSQKNMERAGMKIAYTNAIWEEI